MLDLPQQDSFFYVFCDFCFNIFTSFSGTDVRLTGPSSPLDPYSKIDLFPVWRLVVERVYIF